MTLAVAACGKNDIADKNSSGTTATSDATHGAAADAKAVLAAVEPFEALAETAFTATTAELDKSIRAARDAVNSINKVIPADVASRLQGYISTIESARKTDRRADIAIASIEGFREIVSVASGTSAIPADVSLLDYSGIRFDSDALAKPPRWDDMVRAIAYGRERTAALSRFAPAAKLLPEVEKAFVQMEQAVSLRDVKAARAAAKKQLDLVDELEVAFTPSK